MKASTEVEKEALTSSTGLFSLVALTNWATREMTSEVGVTVLAKDFLRDEMEETPVELVEAKNGEMIGVWEGVELISGALGRKSSGYTGSINGSSDRIGERT